MRLHNRLIKASFWNDPDLLKWPRDKRWFYEGLTQLADDSGCLEDDPFAFKINLFPSPVDADITLEILSEWVEELVQDKKLIRYEVGRKQCLFMVNFHKHQSLKNPAAPEVPLPPFLTWQTYKSNKDAGKYVIDEKLLSTFLEGSEEVLRTFFQPEPEVEPEINRIDTTTATTREEKNENDSEGEEKTLTPTEHKVFQHLESVWGRVLTFHECETLTKNINQFQSLGCRDPDLIIIEAIRRADNAGIRNMRYIDGILLDWQKRKIITIADIEADDEQFQRSKDTKKSRAGPAKKKTGTDSGKYDDVYL